MYSIDFGDGAGPLLNHHQRLHRRHLRQLDRRRPDLFADRRETRGDQHQTSRPPNQKSFRVLLFPHIVDDQ